MNLKDKVRDLLANKNVTLPELKTSCDLFAKDAEALMYKADEERNMDKARAAQRLQFALEHASGTIDNLLKAKAKLEKLVAYEKQTA